MREMERLLYELVAKGRADEAAEGAERAARAAETPPPKRRGKRDA
jgi:hypothetical protein